MPRKYTRKIKRHRSKRGGDIESGIAEDIAPMTSVPPDPERFKKQQQQMIRESLKPVSNEEAEAVFSGPTPEEREKLNAQGMMNEDPLNMDPWFGLNIFSNTGGRRKSKRRRNHKRKNTRRRRR